MADREYKIKTKEGYFDFDNLSANKIHIKDIANALSKINRYTGHTNRPYNVAQHSIFVYQMMKAEGLDKDVCFLGLIHDFHEAYFSDMSSPLKWFLRDKYGFDANEYCDKIDISLYEKLNIEPPTPEQHEIIKFWDYKAYDIERVFLFDDLSPNELKGEDVNIRIFKNKILVNAHWGNELIRTYRIHRKGDVRLIDEVMPKVIGEEDMERGVLSHSYGSVGTRDTYVRDVLGRMMRRVENDPELLEEYDHPVLAVETPVIADDPLAKFFGYILWGRNNGTV